MSMGKSWNDLQKEKEKAYWERNQLVAVLSKIYQSHLSLHPLADREWEKDWRNIVCIHTPNGQATWHIHDSELKNFSHLDFNGNCKWDGHTTEEKYRRLRYIK